MPQQPLKMSHFPITIDGKSHPDPAKQTSYQDAVVALIGKLWWGSRVGRALLEEIKGAKFRLRIEPQPSGQVVPGVVKGTLKGAKYEVRKPPFSGAPELIFGGKADPSLLIVPAQDVTLWFTPGFGTAAKKLLPGLAAALLEDDASLVHELVHVARIMSGNFHAGAMRDGWQDREEFYAVLVHNVYLSEQKRHHLRVSYTSMSTTGNYLSLPPDAFTERYDFEILQFIMEWCAFARKMSAIPCAFNPIRARFKKNPTTMVRNPFCGLAQ